MPNELSAVEKAVVESCYHKIIMDLGRTGRQKGKVVLAFSHKTNWLVTVRSTDYRFDEIEKDPNYEIVGTYSGVPRPSVSDITDDLLSYFKQAVS